MRELGVIPPLRNDLEMRPHMTVILGFEDKFMYKTRMKLLHGSKRGKWITG